jgi:hypothetical protein
VALVMPATLSTITSTFPEDRRARAVARSVLLAAVALLGTLRLVPESADPDAPRLDVGGAAIAVTALVALVYSVIEAPTYGWLATRTLAGLTLALALLVGFVVPKDQQCINTPQSPPAGHPSTTS